MLQQPARPSGNVQLPYTTADMAERLAKRKAAKDRQDILDSLSGGLSYGQGGVDLGSVAKSVGGFLKTAYENMPESIDTPVSSYGTGKSLITEPARLAVRRAVGDITAIPKVGEPSPSYTADRVRQQGVALGVLGAAIDYSQFIPVVAKGAGVASDAINASRIARMNRSPFPTVKTPGAFIDVDALQGSRLPARIVDTPATPATRLAEAQTQRALPPAQVAPIEVAPTTSRLTPPPFRERQVPSTSRLTLEKNLDKEGGSIIIRSFDQETGEYTGVLTIYYDAETSEATVNGLAATNPMVTPQLIAAAATEVRKLVGDVKYPLTPDSNLSETSLPFVERLQQAGLIDPEYELPYFSDLNDIQKTSGPKTFAQPISGYGGFGGAFTNPQEVINPLSYQPTYNQVLQALVESRRQAKLAGEYGKLTTPSSELTPQSVRERLERELQQRTTAHLATLTKPIETLQSTDFPMLSQKYLNDGGVPDLTSEIKQGMSFPVYEIGGQKIAFGNPDLGRFSPEFLNKDVEFVPVNPYMITGLDKTSSEGQMYARLMFDAHQGVIAETPRSKNIGQVSALTYAASRGDNIAFKELERLAMVGQKSLMNKTVEETERILSFHKDWSDPKYWNQKSSVQVQTGIAPDGYTRTQRPMGIDDMFLVHQTDYAPTYDVNGNIVLKPTGDYTPIDPATGKPMIDKISGKPVSMPDRDNVHFTINHLVTGHMERQAPTSGSNVIIVPLRDVLNTNPGSLENLYAIDTFLTPKPGQGLVIPMQNAKVLYQGQSAPGEFEKDIFDALSEVGKRHNNLPDYQTKIILGGPHYAGTQYIDERISQLGLEDIPNEYPEYGGGIIGTTHQNHPSYFIQGFDNFDVQGGESYLTGFNYHRLSPNAKLRIYDSNTSKYTTGKLDVTYQPDYGL